MNWSLFANGKFKMKHAETIYNEDEWGVHDGSLVVFSEPDPGVIAVYPHLPQCTLIARRIEDMSEEEFRKTSRFHKSVKYDRDVWIEHLKIDCEEDAKSGRVNLDLLSIGVYPFDQSHFETGEVIDVNEV